MTVKSLQLAAVKCVVCVCGDMHDPNAGNHIHENVHIHMGVGVSGHGVPFLKEQRTSRLNSLTVCYGYKHDVC